MNAQERTALHTLLAGMGELKAEIIALAQHIHDQNGSIEKHFAEDAEWQHKHDERIAEATGFRKGILWLGGLLITAIVFFANIVVKLAFG